ncbi:unnamed protein product [Caenorhabditis sp. 36 PRJEB53466]|nr:unnamed protein product [Caenorhabditis sp. 36 PRJEB53466]
MAQKSDLSVETNNSASVKPNPPSPKSRLAMLKRTKKASNATSDPFRFQNNGISYKGKLIGEQDVEKARGDAMCAEAMRNAKGIVKAAGAHKTRITLQINIDGIKLVDEKSGAVLHNFPVSRISFIARDSSDARAFGLVYGEPGGKYKFYGIKTAQSADQAVLAIRDMFQVVFEMKKKHIEQVKQQQNQSIGAEMNQSKESGVAVADLLDLESELQQIEQASPFGDPFVDSFNTTATSTGTSLNISNLSANQSAQRNYQFSAVQHPARTYAWPTDNGSTMAAPTIPFDAWRQVSQGIVATTPMHHAQSTPAFGSNGFSDTNPFAAAYGGHPTPATVPAATFQDPFIVGLRGSVDWNGTSATTKENTAPTVATQSLHHASTFANFGDKVGSWEEKKVSSLEEAFTKLVDMDALVGGTAVKETKKNPFEHILNPPKASLNSLSTTCSAAQLAATHHVVPQTADPFADIMRNILINSLLISFAVSQLNRAPTTDVIDKILGSAETKTIAQINKEIDMLVDKLDETTKQEHKAWKLKVEQDERERKLRIFKVLPRLSTRTQQKLIRIVMTQQNQTLSIGEKERILRHISMSMDGTIKTELARFLSDKDLFSLIY